MVLKKKIQLKKKVPPKKATIKAKFGLNYVEKKQVTSLAVKAINRSAESKYFESTNMNTLTRLAPLQSRNGNTAMAVQAFAVGSGASPQMSSVTYGWQNGTGNINITDLNMTRLFAPQDQTGPTDPLAQNSLEGSYASPSMCRTEWYLQIPQVDTTVQQKNGTPTYVRILRVKPRKQKYADLSINPKNDLFVNQFGQEAGINFTSFNEMELKMFKPNSRKYEIIADIQKRLVPASTIATLDIAAGNTITTDLSRSASNCRLVMNHKQPKKLYYTAAVDGAQPRDGQSNEMIFFHYVKEGTEGAVTANERALELTCKPVSTFKDF